jgi:hypothetical protein
MVPVLAPVITATLFFHSIGCVHGIKDNAWRMIRPLKATAGYLIL